MPEGEGVRQGERERAVEGYTVRIAMHGVCRTGGLIYFRGINRVPSDLYASAISIDFLFTSALHTRRQAG